MIQQWFKWNRLLRASWSFHLWRFSKERWPQFWSTVLGKGPCLDSLQRSLPTSAAPWVNESMTWDSHPRRASIIALIPLVVVEMPMAAMKEKTLTHWCFKTFCIQFTLRTKCVRLFFFLFLAKPLHIFLTKSVLGIFCVWKESHQNFPIFIIYLDICKSRIIFSEHKQEHSPIVLWKWTTALL